MLQDLRRLHNLHLPLPLHPLQSDCQGKPDKVALYNFVSNNGSGTCKVLTDIVSE